MSLGPGEHTRVRRMPEYAAYDEASVYGVLDDARYCYLVGVVDSLGVALPTIHLREGRSLYLHGSRSHALFRHVLEVGRATLSATVLEGLRLARSGFESSLAYRSVFVVGEVREVTDLLEKRRVLDGFVDRVLPGRVAEVRPVEEREVSLTTVLRLEISEASVKAASGPTKDEPADAALDIWAGFVPLYESFGTPVAQRDGAQAHRELPLPPSLRRLS
ncbi:MAG: pyridoxamine 5'-phosphate oxidase family protein [Acidimicrobiaceae bacterium]|nr:pyridoxamine 5'-phosphate oxidase family protein [Acidimicrobiaceae bacterium]